MAVRLSPEAPRYAISPEFEHEHRRLRLLEQAIDRFTISGLENVTVLRHEIPSKRYDRTDVSYLTQPEIDALLLSGIPDNCSWRRAGTPSSCSGGLAFPAARVRGIRLARIVASEL
jgi:hypothetical protein